MKVLERDGFERPVKCQMVYEDTTFSVEEGAEFIIAYIPRKLAKPKTQGARVMCKCTPEIRTPFCGKPSCTWPPQTTPLAPTLEQDVTAWQAIEKARYTLETLLKLNGLDTRSETLVIEALAKLGSVKHYINTRRAQRIEDAANRDTPPASERPPPAMQPPKASK